MALELNFVGSWPRRLKAVGSRVGKALINDDLPAGVINLKLVDDTEIASLNEKYTGNAYATDVLTFPYSEDANPIEGELADVVISQDMAARQAEAAGTTLDDEVGLLVLHGILHALGYDHATAEDRTRFEDLQQRILKAAGITHRDFEWKS